MVMRIDDPASHFPRRILPDRADRLRAALSERPMIRCFVALAAFACRRPSVVMLAAVLAVAGAMLFCVDRAAMTTDTAALISPKVAWRVNGQRFDDAFPQGGDTSLAVIDGATPEIAEQAAAALTATLATDKRHVRRVTRPDGGPYLAREGLLFGSLPEVNDATAKMVSAQPFLGPLAADPTLHGIAGVFDTLLQGVRAATPRSMASTPRSPLSPTRSTRRRRANPPSSRGSDCSAAGRARWRRRRGNWC